MRPQGMKPRFGMQGQHRPNSSNVNNTRPPFQRGPWQSRGNGNPNRHDRPPGPYSPVGPNGQMMGPNGPMMGSGMLPSGTTMRPNMPPPGFMDPSAFNMMMMMRPPMPGMPMPGMPMPGMPMPGAPIPGTPMPGAPVPGIPMTMGPPMLTNGGYGKGPNQPLEKASACPGNRDKKNESNDNSENNTSNGENFNYNFSNFGVAPGMKNGWDRNASPGAWNFGTPTNQYYYPNQNHNQETSNQSSNQDYSPNFYQNYGYTQNYEGYNQYYNQGQPFMQSNYYNVKEEYPDIKPSLNYNYNGAPNMGPPNAGKNRKRKEMSQKMRTHYCDTCDRSFPTEEALSIHLSEHKVCGLDDCKFTAHPRVVEKHQQMQHYTGLYRRIGSLYTPEDIERWRKDRKKNYPTPQHVEERRAKQTEMFARGERMGTPNNRFGRNNQQRNNGFPQKRHHRANHEDDENPRGPPRHPPPDTPAEPPKKWKPIFPPVVEIIEESEERSGVKPFPGTNALRPIDNNTTAKNDASKLSEKINTSNPLSFLSVYGNSSSEEDSDAENSPNDSTSCNVEKSTLDKRTSELVIVQDDSASLENTQVSSVLEPDNESSDEPLPVAALQPTISELYSNNYLEEKKEGDNAFSDTTNIVPPQSQCETETIVSGNVDDTTNNEKSDDFPKSCSIESLNVSQTPTSPLKKIQTTSEPDSPTDPQTLTRFDSSPENIRNDETKSVPAVSDDSASDKQTNTNIPTIPTGEMSLQQPSEEMKQVNDCSDDSGPEEIPITKDSGVGIGEEEGDIDEADNKAGGRKRKRQSRQPLKKLKTDEEKHTNETETQQQPCNNNQGRYQINHRVPRPPRPRAPTLLEKLLTREICHERNVILQCVRYVVENNYFRADRLEHSKANTGTL